MNKKSKRKSAVKSSLLVLLLIAILLIVSTYAWFTANKTVTISTIDVQVAAQNGLQISLDGSTWKSIITAEDLAGIANAYTNCVNVMPDTMEPVSTAGTINTSTGYLNMYFGTVAANTTTGEDELTAVQTTEAEATPKFIAFDVFLKLDATDKTNGDQIYLTNASRVGPTTGRNDMGLQNAARAAFCLSSAVANGTALGTIQALKCSSENDVYIWEPNYDVHTSSGVSAAYSNYQVTTTQTNATQLDCYGILAPIPVATPIQLLETNYNGAGSTISSTYFSKVTPAISTTVENPAYSNAFILKNGITKCRIYLWVEGQDVDCENSASGADISYDIQFSLNSSAAETP